MIYYITNLTQLTSNKLTGKFLSCAFARSGYSNSYSYFSLLPIFQDYLFLYGTYATNVY